MGSPLANSPVAMGLCVCPPDSLGPVWVACAVWSGQVSPSPLRVSTQCSASWPVGSPRLGLEPTVTTTTTIMVSGLGEMSPDAYFPAIFNVSWLRKTTTIAVDSFTAPVRAPALLPSPVLHPSPSVPAMIYRRVTAHYLPCNDPTALYQHPTRRRALHPTPHAPPQALPKADICLDNLSVPNGGVVDEFNMSFLLSLATLGEGQHPFERKVYSGT